MRNHIEKVRIVTFLGSCATILSACALIKTHQTRPLSPVPLTEEPIALTLKPTTSDRTESTRYFSRSQLDGFEDGQKVLSREETVVFTIRAEGQPSRSKNQIRWILSAEDKDGTVALNDLAFPEVGEKMEVIYRPNGQVIKAGKQPKDSVFYVPPLSLPKRAVKVGDTWEMTAHWASLKNNLPMVMSIVTIFKGLYDCGGSGKCADLEISAVVDMAHIDKTVLDFRSESRGRLLFSVDKGTVVWSMVQSHESLTDRRSHMKVNSCLTSRLLEPKSEALEWAQKLSCQPQEDTIELPQVSAPAS